MEKDFGVVLSAVFNLISDKAGQEAAVTFEFGVNKVPTQEQVEAALQESVKTLNKALKVKDARLATIRDRGFADMPSMAWPPATP